MNDVQQRVVSGLMLALACHAAWVLSRAFWAARGTSLRPAIVWQCVAVALTVPLGLRAFSPASFAVAEMARWSCLSMLACLAGLLAILNARRPGNGAWAWLCLALVVVSLVPWLEQSGLRGLRTGAAASPPRLEFPWNVFYVLLAAVVVTNHAPTRHGRAFVLLLLPAVAFQLGLLIAPGLLPTRAVEAWLVWPLTYLTAVAAVAWPHIWGARATGSGPLARVWLWFRDRWGAVWGLRMLERFHREAEIRGWRVRLGWDGPVEPAADEAEELAAAHALMGLLHRFADRGVLERVAKIKPKPSDPESKREARLSSG